MFCSGQVGKGRSRGYLCQNVLAVEAETGNVLGLVDQILHHRDEVPDDETLVEPRQRETRESLLWLYGTEHLPADTKLIDVADQGSDAFEFIEHEFKSGRRSLAGAYPETNRPTKVTNSVATVGLSRQLLRPQRLASKAPLTPSVEICEESRSPSEPPIIGHVELADRAHDARHGG